VASNGPFQVYFFDGPHEQQDHYRAMIDYFEFLDDYNVVILVDDWNYVDVRIGTHSALSQLPLKIIYAREIFTSENAPSDVVTDWHNGLGVFVISKVMDRGAESVKIDQFYANQHKEERVWEEF